MPIIETGLAAPILWWGATTKAFMGHAPLRQFYLYAYASKLATLPNKTACAHCAGFCCVGMTGFEPAASSSRTKRATELRYIPYCRSCKNMYFTKKFAMQKGGLPLRMQPPEWRAVVLAKWVKAGSLSFKVTHVSARRAFHVKFLLLLLPVFE